MTRLIHKYLDNMLDKFEQCEKKSVLDKVTTLRAILNEAVEVFGLKPKQLKFYIKGWFKKRRRKFNFTRAWNSLIIFNVKQPNKKLVRHSLRTQNRIILKNRRKTEAHLKFPITYGVLLNKIYRGLDGMLIDKPKTKKQKKLWNQICKDSINLMECDLDEMREEYSGTLFENSTRLSEKDLIKYQNEFKNMELDLLKVIKKYESLKIVTDKRKINLAV